MTLSRHRLRDAKAFDSVFKGNTYRVASNAFLFLAMANDLDHGRLGMVIGKKNIRLATNRNRVKRALREAFRQYFKNASLDVVVVARSGANIKEKPLLNEQIHALMQKLQQKLHTEPND